MVNFYLFRNRITHAFLLFIFMVAASISLAQTTVIFIEGGLVYKVTSPTTVSVTICPGSGITYSGAYNIPPSVSHDGTTYTVTGIDNSAFAQGGVGQNVTSVTIPNTVTSIGSYAFYNGAITSIDIPNSVKIIMNNAFNSCKVTNFIIPNSVTIIGDNAFSRSAIESLHIGNGITSIGTNLWGANPVYDRYATSPLKSVSVNSDNPNYASVDGILYNKELTKLIICPPGKTVVNQIPATVTIIADGAFYKSSASAITFPESLQRIEDRAFNVCSITDLVIPNSVNYINYNAFDNTKLKTIFIGKGMTTIPVELWGANPGTRILNSILVSSDNPNYSSVDGILYNKAQTKLLACPPAKLTANLIPPTVTLIKDKAFYCSYISSITIPASVIQIETEAFAQCTKLTSVVIPNSVIIIDKFAFDGCTNLASVEIPNSVTYIGSNAFSHCNITSISIPNSVTYLGQNALGWKLETLHLGNGITTIPADFWGLKSDDSYIYPCTLRAITVNDDNPNFSSVDGILYNKAKTILISCPQSNPVVNQIPNTVTHIAEKAFLGFLGTSVTLPGSVKEIGKKAFLGSKLSSISLPASTTLIDDQAFSKCPDLASVNLSEGLKRIGNSAFEWCKSLASIDIPNTVTDIGKETFFSVDELAHVKLSESLTEIKSSVFYCTKLTSLDIPNSVVTINTCAFSGTKLETVVIGKGYKEDNYSKVQLTWENIPNISISEDNPNFTIDNGIIYNKNKTTLIVCPREKIFDAPLVIAATTKRISWNAFARNKSITEITLPASVEFIENSVFEFCSNLTKVTIEGPVASLPDLVFAYCDNLAEVVLPASITQIHNYVFDNCDKLAHIHCQAVIPPWCNAGAFSNRTKDCTVFVPFGSKAAYEAHEIWKDFNILEEGENLYEPVATLTPGGNDEIHIGINSARSFSIDWGDGNLIEYAAGDYDRNGETMITGTPVGETITIHGSAADITLLNVDDNALTAIDVSKLTALLELRCYLNNLTSLDVSSNSALTNLICSYNQLTSLDLSQNPALSFLDFANNQLTGLDVSQNPALVTLSIGNNQFSSEALNALYVQLPDITGVAPAQEGDWDNYWRKKLFVAGNPGADASNTKIATDKGWICDVEGVISEPIATLTVAEGTTTYFWIEINSESVFSIDWGDGNLVEYEAGEHNLFNNSISGTPVGTTVTLHGIAADISLINCQGIIGIDVSKLTNLTSLLIYDSPIASLDVSHNAALTYLGCVNNQFSAIDVSHNPALTFLNFADNQLTGLDVSHNQALVTVNIGNNLFSSEALNALYVQLPDITGVAPAQDNYWKKKLFVAENPGAEASNTKIATNKGWICDVETNQAPVANAGANQIVNEGATVTLDGSLSSDEDGDDLSYVWTAPAGITLSNSNIAKPTFVAPDVDADTEYTFTLVVNDGKVSSTSTTVTVTVKNTTLQNITGITFTNGDFVFDGTAKSLFSHPLKMCEGVDY